MDKAMAHVAASGQQLAQRLADELVPGARNAIRTCLRLEPHERLTLITDRETADIAHALLREVEEVGAQYSLFVLEDYVDSHV